MPNASTACPHCGEVYDVDESSDGYDAECGECGRDFTVALLSSPSHSTPQTGQTLTLEALFQRGLSVVDDDLPEAQRLIKLAAAKGHQQAIELAEKLDIIDDDARRFHEALAARDSAEGPQGASIEDGPECEPGIAGSFTGFLLQERQSKDLCWFCEKRKASGNKAKEVSMYGDVSHGGYSFDVLGPSRRVNFRQVKIEVPRCSTCARAHSVAMAVTCLLVIIVAAVWVYRLLSSDFCQQEGDWLFLGFVGTCTGGAVGLLIASLITPLLRPKYIKSVWHSKSYPRIKELMEQGWKLGFRPRK
jgi:hypothetical protein